MPSLGLSRASPMLTYEVRLTGGEEIVKLVHSNRLFRRHNLLLIVGIRINTSRIMNKKILRILVLMMR